MGCSTLHLLALAWAADILGEFQVVWEGVSSPLPLAPRGSCAAEFFPGILLKLQKLHVSSSPESPLSDAWAQNTGMACLVWELHKQRRGGGNE